MSPFLVSILLVLALVLPLLGAVVLRLLDARLSPQQRTGIAGLVIALPIFSVIVLSRANIPSLRIAGVTVLFAEEAAAAPLPLEILDALPVDDEQPEPHDHATEAPAAAPPATVATVALTAVPTEAPTEAPTDAPTVAPTALPTEAPTAVPTATPEPPTPTSPPPTVPPAAPAPARRTYVVQQGDTLRGIAEQFDVTVGQLLEANNLTPAQADALRPGQELVIP